MHYRFCILSIIVLLSQCSPVKPVNGGKDQPQVRQTVKVIYLLPDEKELQVKAPDGFSISLMDWSLGAWEPHVTHGPGRLLSFRLRGLGESKPPLKATITYHGHIPPGNYRLEGTFNKLDGNGPRGEIRQLPSYKIVFKQNQHEGAKKFSVPVTATAQSSGFDIRLEGRGAFSGGVRDLKLVPVR